MQIDNETITKFLNELKRIADALEVLAIHADDRFVPFNPQIREWKREDLRRSRESE